MIDSHCHLADAAFVEDVDAVIGRAKAAGLKGALCIVDAESDAERARAVSLAARWTGLRFAIGIHPHHAGRWADALDEAVRASHRAFDHQPAARAVGEIGLDYHYDFAPKPVQRALFAVQLQVALERRLPVVVHTREAENDTLSVIRDAGPGRLRGVMHCFTGTPAFARRALDLGFHISLSGIVTFPKATTVHEVARLVPDDRLLIETDSPFLAPVPHRGGRNEPAWLVHVAHRLAELRGRSPGAVADQTTANYETLFGTSEPCPERMAETC